MKRQNVRKGRRETENIAIWKFLMARKRWEKREYAIWIGKKKQIGEELKIITLTFLILTPSTLGPDLSTVSVFFKEVPCSIDFKISKFAPPAPLAGGGGGGGGGPPATPRGACFFAPGALGGLGGPKKKSDNGKGNNEEKKKENTSKQMKKGRGKELKEKIIKGRTCFVSP